MHETAHAATIIMRSFKDCTRVSAIYSLTDSSCFDRSMCVASQNGEGLANGASCVVSRASHTLALRCISSGDDVRGLLELVAAKRAQ